MFDGHHVIVLERPLDCVDLFDHLNKQHDNTISEQESKRIFRELVNAVTYLDKKGIVHHDLKSENILLDLSNGGKVKLIDFGLACHVKDKPITNFFGK